MFGSLMIDSEVDGCHKSPFPVVKAGQLSRMWKDNFANHFLKFKLESLPQASPCLRDMVDCRGQAVKM